MGWRLVLVEQKQLMTNHPLDAHMQTFHSHRKKARVSRSGGNISLLVSSTTLAHVQISTLVKPSDLSSSLSLAAFPFTI